jgi:hypothetical protein
MIEPIKTPPIIILIPKPIKERGWKEQVVYSENFKLKKGNKLDVIG